MITIPQLTAELRKLLDTPFQHAGRVPGPNGGLDCGGMMVVALRNLGYEVYDKPFYKRADGLTDMIEVLEHNYFSRKEDGANPEPGDLILIRSSIMYHHLVYVTEDSTIIHAWYTTGLSKVTESFMLPEWSESIHSVWHWTELE